TQPTHSSSRIIPQFTILIYLVNFLWNSLPDYTLLILVPSSFVVLRTSIARTAVFGSVWSVLLLILVSWFKVFGLVVLSFSRNDNNNNNNNNNNNKNISTRYSLSEHLALLRSVESAAHST